MPKAGGTFTGNITVSLGAPTIILNGTAGNSRSIHFRSSTLERWTISASSAAETGSNAGSGLLINRFNDAGVLIDSPVTIVRATGLMVLADGLQVNGGSLDVNGPILGEASTLAAAGFNLPPGVAPTAPNDGDFWTTSAGVFAQVDGATQQLGGLPTLGALALLNTPTFATAGAFNAGQDYATPLTVPTATEVGYMGTPQNVKAGNYTLVLTDRGKDVFFTGNATATIPAHASVNFPLGAIGKISADAGVTVTIAITTDVLRWVPTNGTGSRTLTGPGEAWWEKKKTGEVWIRGDLT